MPPDARGSVYAFEEIDDQLPFLPLAARRALDAAGVKLSLAAWVNLSLDDRWALVASGAVSGSPQSVAEVIARAHPAAEPIAAVPEPSSEAPPAALTEALKTQTAKTGAEGNSDRVLEPGMWSEITSLDRYALVKLQQKPDKLARAFDEIVGRPLLSHLRAGGSAHMVDVAAKAQTARRAVASATLRTTRAVVVAIARGGMPKGDVLAVARVAGLLASKRTPELVPLCHPVQTTAAAIDFEPDAARGVIGIRATVDAVDRTGVEMEAMVAASVAALTLYDMIKSADRWASIAVVQLESKSGGKSGEVRRPSDHQGT